VDTSGQKKFEREKSNKHRSFQSASKVQSKIRTVDSMAPMLRGWSSSHKRELSRDESEQRKFLAEEIKKSLFETKRDTVDKGKIDICSAQWPRLVEPGFSQSGAAQKESPTQHRWGSNLSDIFTHLWSDTVGKWLWIPKTLECESAPAAPGELLGFVERAEEIRQFGKEARKIVRVRPKTTDGRSFKEAASKMQRKDGTGPFPK
jgi:hypothetical protein